jgi:hydroxymethylglutaryl-CoA reductase
LLAGAVLFSFAAVVAAPLTGSKVLTASNAANATATCTIMSEFTVFAARSESQQMYKTLTALFELLSIHVLKTNSKDAKGAGEEECHEAFKNEREEIRR